jgi:Kelch motif
MKKKSTSKSAFFNLRVLIAAVFCLIGVSVALLGSGLFAQTKGAKNSRSSGAQDAPGTQTPDVIRLIGPVRQDQDLRSLPYVPQAGEVEHRRLTRYPRPDKQPPADYGTSKLPQFQSLLKNIFRPTPTMPAPLLTFDGINSAQSLCGCFPPDTNGDVGPNHYVETTNVAIKIFDKNGNTLSGPTSFNSFFSTLPAPCGNANSGDPFVFYDQVADRWVVSDFAFASLNGPFYQCIGVSQTGDPVSGGWFLYAVQHDAANPQWLGDYPKLAMWNNPQPGGAYLLTINLFFGPTLGPFEGVGVFALDRGSMLTGGPANAIHFDIPIAGLGDSYSLVAATFRTGNPPPAGRDEMLLSVDSPATGGVVLTQVHAWRFHVDFVTPANSTLGVGANHTPNAQITVNGFVDAFTNTTSLLVPQPGTGAHLDTLGDKIMTPMVYQLRNGTESLWADQTILLNYPNGPTAVRWYQFDVTGGNFPVTPVQQQDWTNGNDGLWRWMPSIAVDQNGNTAIGYSTSSASIFPGIRYAGRLASDPPGNLAQGEAIMTNGGGSQTDTRGRWGDYTMTTLDTDGMTFWHANEYLTTTSSSSWSTKIGKFNFVGGGGSPTPTPTASPSCTPSSGAWTDRATIPAAPGLIRADGVYWPANGLAYVLGGRTSDTAGSFNQVIYTYNATTNTWAQASTMLTDMDTSNLATVMLNGPAGPRIYAVGGAIAGAGVTPSDIVRIYDPATGTLTTGTPWPQTPHVLPGGWAVYNNKLYIFGGFDPVTGGGSMTDNIWIYDPMVGAGGTWTQSPAHLALARGYIPTTLIGNFMYLAGGSQFSGGTLTNETITERYDPVTNTICDACVADLPNATSNAKGFTDGTLFYVPGGFFPTANDMLQIYNPGSNSWTTGPVLLHPVRNYAKAQLPTSFLVVGGYDAVVGISNWNQQFTFGAPCPSPTPTPTPTATATATATATPTSTPAPTPRTTPTPRPRPTPPPRP